MRYLTKSRFKLAMECPTKLFYTGKKEEYADRKFDDPFLAQLANGGFQVGELAKYYYPGGVEVKGLDYDKTVAKTNEHLKTENVTLFEAAVRYENLFIRVDVLRRRGNYFELIEVKAKSFDSSLEEPFLNKNGTIKAPWLPYLYDVAFQKHVLEQAFPEFGVTAYLLLTDKNTICPTDGLNQKFRVVKDPNGQKTIEVPTALSPEDISERIMSEVNVNDICEQIYDGTHIKNAGDRGFVEKINYFAEYYENDNRIPSTISGACGTCEFKTKPEDEKKGLRSGFKECWSDQLGWKDKDFETPTILDVWDLRIKDRLLAEKRASISDLTPEDLKLKDDGKLGLSRTERQLMQIEKAQAREDSYWIDKDNLTREMTSWTFPLHFIDFETSQTAIPFNKGHRPYEPIAFQFSHHTVMETGEVSHAGEFLAADPGVFPNFSFLRELKAQLENDNGTIFRYAAHENTYLSHIYKQLKAGYEDCDDRDELIEFLQLISKSSSSSADKWEGRRNMVDMLYLVKRFYYDPLTNGSNSIKDVLPAVMNRSVFVREKYSKPIYGSDDVIPSLNFKNKIWVEFEDEDDEVVDPYQLLGKMFEDISDHDFEILSEDDELKDGGAAMAAYAKLQFEDMSDYERERIEKALLRYCELDTLAMVMIYEGWREMLQK